MSDNDLSRRWAVGEHERLRMQDIRARNRQTERYEEMKALADKDLLLWAIAQPWISELHCDDAGRRPRKTGKPLALIEWYRPGGLYAEYWFTTPIVNGIPQMPDDPAEADRLREAIRAAQKERE